MSAADAVTLLPFGDRELLFDLNRIPMAVQRECFAEFAMYPEGLFGSMGSGGIGRYTVAGLIWVARRAAGERATFEATYDAVSLDDVVALLKTIRDDAATAAEPEPDPVVVAAPVTSDEALIASLYASGAPAEHNGRVTATRRKRGAEPPVDTSTVAV